MGSDGQILVCWGFSFIFKVQIGLLGSVPSSCVFSMSTETEEQHLVLQPEDVSTEPSGKPRRSYTIEFLLSFSELEVCKKLPDGFDKSLLSEFEDGSFGIQDRPRVLGSSPLQGFRRTDYGTGSSPPARGDSANYSRGLNKWDSRSSGRSDTDSDSEAGRRFSSQARKSGQNAEHDGLLGSGSFPRPAGYAAGTSVPRFRPNGNLPLSRSNEPYQPPRPYKAVPHSRRETNDSFNDETFGSTDSTGDDRAEEEKKRRAEFELMRKEQQKALQEKQKSNSGKPEDPFSAIARQSENSNDKKISSNPDKVLKQVPQDDSSKLPIPPQAPPSRPLVPPGFVNSVVDKSSIVKSLVHGDSSEVGKFDVGISRQDMKSATHAAVDTIKEPSFPDVSEVLENGEMLVLDSEVTGHKLLGESGRSTSILEKLFGNTSTTSSGSASKFVEDHDSKTADIGSPNTLHSKFARWFLEDDKKPLGNTPSEPGDLLSLIGGGVKVGSDVPDVPVLGPILPPDTMLGHTSSELESAHSSADISVRFPSTNGPPEPKAAVLTCEDLEQSILSEVGGNSSNSQPAGKVTSALDVKVGAQVDNQASHHLLSLLQRGMGSKNVKATSNVEELSFDKGCDREVGKVDVINDNTRNVNADELNSSGKTLTLESLFGTAFMKELHSAQNNSGSAQIEVSEPPGSPFSLPGGAPFPCAMNDIGSGLGSRDGRVSASSDRIGKLNEGHWLGFHESGRELEFSKTPAQVDSKFSSNEGGMGVRYPEEDSFIRSLGDSINAQNSVMVPDLAPYDKNFLSSSSNTSVNVMDKLAMLGARRKDERLMRGAQDPSFMHGPYDMAKPELPFQNLHPQPSSPRLHAAQMNPGTPMFHALDSHPAHLDPHLQFMPPDVPMHNQLPTNMGHHPPQGPPHHTAGLPGFDQLVRPPMLQQMPMSGSLAPPQLMRGFPGSGPMPAHPGHNPAGYIPEHSPMQGFPFGQRQPHFGGPGMAPPGAELGGGNNPPEAFQRLLEMELRANPKQMHPFATGGGGGGGHSRPMYGHELDMGFRYR